MIQGHGDDAYRYGHTIRADFSSNVWYGPLDPGLQKHLQEKIGTITHYPDAGAERAQIAASRHYDVAPEKVLATNGATEALYLFAQAYQGRSATTLFPAFAEYEDACRLHNIDIHYQSSETLSPDSRFHTDMVFICNPNNPTGAALPLETLTILLQSHPTTTFLIDESYIEFTRATTSLLPHLGQYSNVILLRSLTKSSRIPGLRIGFALGASALIGRLRQYKMPWSVNRLALEAACYIFQHPHPLPLSTLLDRTATWRSELQAATGWIIHPSDTHYFLIESRSPAAPAPTPAQAPASTPPPTQAPISAVAPQSASAPAPTPAPIPAATLKQWLIDHHGLLIRDASNFRGLTPFHFRVACQSPEHNRLLTEALRQCSQTGC